ncbi:DUF1365 domain-containing protein [Streptomyces sp. NPDC002564]|uniref:DUF1365 domain-containing protein n=1 Tax=Streptomyces sp. NPDC002564 TaxID=3364649 RepID=UPI0036CF4C60
MTPPARHPTAPALYPSEITHVRTLPRRYALTHRTYLWLVDLDRLPALPAVLRPLARFLGRDHFAGRDPGIRTGLERYLRAHDIDLDGGQVLMLGNARVLGHVFNPLTVFWCHDPDGTLRCVVAEVHNTYGERHCYLLYPDAGGRADTGKDFYVSPFFAVDGAYRMRLPVPGERLSLTVHLEQSGARPFTATVRGERHAATPRSLLRAVARRPFATLAVSLAIRRHGIRLWLRGQPVVPRPGHRPQKGMQ